MQTLDATFGTLLTLVVCLVAVTEIVLMLNQLGNDLARVNLQLRAIVESDRMMYNSITGYALLNKNTKTVMPGHIDYEKLSQSGELTCKDNICKSESPHITRVGVYGNETVWIKV